MENATFLTSERQLMQLINSWWTVGCLLLWCLTPLSTIAQLYRESFYGGGTGLSEENHRPVSSHWQTLLYNVVSSTPHLSGIRTHNVSGSRHWLHM